MTDPTRIPPAPDHLRPATRAWWTDIATGWTLEAHHLQLLTRAGEMLDRAAEAREAVERDGPYQTTDSGAIRRHPALTVERDAVTLHARLMRELDLDGQPQPDVRPPRIRSRT